MQYVAAVSLADTVTELCAGRLDLHAHVDARLDRIEAVDPALRALLPEPGRRARLHAAADALLAGHPEAAGRPPLFGALVGVKDVLHVDGLPTAGGSRVPAEELAGHESAAVRSLRAAGALVLGKTHTAEFAYAAPGPTRNPHDPARTPGGSSHGSAAGVAAGFFPLALGTQTIGSTIRPAAFCGVVGYVPSYGRIRTDGSLHVARSLDRIGLLASDVRGVALAAAVLVESWHPVGGALLPVLGVAEGPFLEAVEPAARELFERQVEALAATGYQVRRLSVFEDAEEVAASLRRLMNGELAREHADLTAAPRSSGASRWSRAAGPPGSTCGSPRPRPAPRQRASPPAARPGSACRGRTSACPRPRCPPALSAGCRSASSSSPAGTPTRSCWHGPPTSPARSAT